MTRIDRYFRREDTLLAEGLKAVCSHEGQEYRNCGFKKTTEILVASPLAVTTLPIVGALALAVKLEDGGSAFYVQERVNGEGKTFPLVKIRCMRKDADQDTLACLKNAVIFGEAADPRNTGMGKFMRQFELEELPQLWQVLRGELSLIDIRALALYAIKYIEEKRPSSFHEWWEAYTAGRPGLFSLNAAVSKSRKDDTKRHHLDLLYSKKASLGLDLFILYRTGLRMGGKLYQKLASKLPART